jgi:hypothetical protein
MRFPENLLYVRLSSMYGFTSVRLRNTYIMIVCHSSFSKYLVIPRLALPSCPQKRLRFESFSPTL